MSYSTPFKIRPYLIRPYLLLASALPASVAVQAQEPASLSAAPAAAPVPSIVPELSTEPEVALDELIRRAFANSPQLPIARENVEAARQRVKSSRALPGPVLQVVPGIGNPEARDEEIVLSQSLDVFGKRRARAGVTSAELRRAQAEGTLAERSLVVAVKNAATDLFAAQEAEALGQYQVEVARLFRDAAARRAELGDVPPVQVQRIELEVLRVENELTGVQGERLVRRAVLNQLVGQAPETPLRVALPIATTFTDILRLRPQSALQTTPPNGVVNGGAFDNGATTGDDGAAPIIGASSQVVSDLVAQRAQLLPGLENRPDIASAQATLEARRAQIRVLERERRPDVEIQARRNAVTGSGDNALRAVITIPIFDFGSNKGERRALEAEARAQEAQIALLKSQAATQVEQALIRLQQQRATVERYRSGIVPQTLDLLRKTQIGYAAGASTYLEVLEAQRTLRAVQTEYLQALVGTRTSEAQLESALGTNLPTSLLGEISNPGGASTPPGVAAPGTIPESVVPANPVEPLAVPSDTTPATEAR